MAYETTGAPKRIAGSKNVFEWLTTIGGGVHPPPGLPLMGTRECITSFLLDLLFHSCLPSHFTHSTQLIGSCPPPPPNLHT